LRGDQKLCREVRCGACEYAEDLRGCASKHVAEARRLISEGKVEEANGQLVGLEKHLIE